MEIIDIDIENVKIDIHKIASPSKEDLSLKGLPLCQTAGTALS
jgi:hypothetical protein